MTHAEALKKIIILWVIFYEKMQKESVHVLHNMYINKTLISTVQLNAASIVVFGTQHPKYEELTLFIDKYGDWMIAIHESMASLLAGEITFEEIIFIQSAQETWL